MSITFNGLEFVIEDIFMWSKKARGKEANAQFFHKYIIFKGTIFLDWWIYYFSSSI
jgi:hypothetical protein